MLKRLLSIWFRRKGWRFAGHLPRKTEQCILLVAPVSGSEDLYIGVATAYLARLEVEILLPQSAFRSPIRAMLLRAIGCSAIPTASEAEMSHEITGRFKPKTPKLLALAPQLFGLNTPLGSFWYDAAKAKHLPVALIGIDHRNKVVKFHSWFYVSGNRERDIEFVYNFFAGIQPADPAQTIERFPLPS